MCERDVLDLTGMTEFYFYYRKVLLKKSSFFYPDFGGHGDLVWRGGL